MNKVRIICEGSKGSTLGRLRLFVTIQPRRYWRAWINETVFTKHWDHASERLKQDAPNAHARNKYLDKLQRHFTDFYYTAKTEGALSERTLKNQIDTFLLRRPVDFYDVIDMIIKEKYNTALFSDTTPRKYRNVRDKLHAFSPRLTFDGITIDFFYKWVDFLFSEYSLSTNTVNRYVKFFKTLLYEASERGYNTNMAFQSKRFKVKGVKTPKPYLTINELDRIFSMHCKESALENVRIGFLRGCYSGLRHSDWSQINKSHLKTVKGRDYLYIIPAKTRRPVMVPAFDRLQTLLEIPCKILSNQKTNNHIKEICKRAGIDSPFYKVRYIGKKVIKEHIPKYEAITTHAARRSFVCNALEKGIPARYIMQITGHTTEKALNDYCFLSSVDGLEMFRGAFV